MKYIETDSKVREQIAAIEKLEGYPLKPFHIGLAFAAAQLVPDVYMPGAVGWTDKVADIIDVGGGDSECELIDLVVSRQTGKSTVIDGKMITVNIVIKTTQTEVKTTQTATKA